MLEHLTPRGRISRGTWWLIGLIPLFISIGLLGLTLADHGGSSKTLALVLTLASFWLMLCANIRRYHDVGKSGWWVLIGLIPFVGAIWQMIELGMIAGDEGDNHYGPPPGSTEAKTFNAREERSGVDLSKFDAAYFAERAAQMSSQPRQGIPVTANRPATGPAVFGKR